ncbi:MAG: sigma 54-interacting transcriptional regulator, partial [Planctomycetales bacterium]|nr:sigma 54-interacting transcriptional regulator [Planctomycetales bacterium]
KELIAEAIWKHSLRAGNAFLTINCAAIPETILESELFGHERGAFTGAHRTRIGKFEQVDGGTLFLDEIGDMSSMTQAKVLRLLQDGSFQRVGGNHTHRGNVRIIAATNRDLEEMVAQGKFREDLYYRLCGFVIDVPPLRERIEDLEPLVQHFVMTFGRELGRQIRVI